MRPFDSHQHLAERPFDYQFTKDGRLLITWHGKQVTIVRGEKAAKLSEELQSADEDAVQLILARVTGHFKHGNERPG
jgi:hypothetical protein